VVTTRALVEVIGRDDEVAAVETFLGSLRYGPAGLVLEGEAGIGKTTVWRAAVEAARDRAYGVLVARPSESEAALSFLGLGDLLEAVREEALKSLPEPQRSALETALLRTSGDGRGDRVALARGTLNVLRELAAERPTLIAIDDIQWLDSPSADALRFLFRRVADERVGLLASVRGEGGAAPLEIDRAIPPERLQRTVLRPLRLADLVNVVRAHRDVAFTRPTWRAIHRTSGGNPFFAIQLADAVSARGGIAPGEELALPETLSAAVQERLEPLSAAGRRALLDVSLLAQPTPALVEAGEGVTEALEAHVLELDGDRLRFTHPLLASAVQADASSGERRAAHCRLAAIVEDPEERALHLGRGSQDPNEEVAATLEEAAERARWRGLAETAAELAEQAERLTPPDRPEDAARRGASAGRNWNTAGDGVRSAEVLRRVVKAAPHGDARARALTLLGFIFDDVQAHERALEETRDPALLAVIHADLSEAEFRQGHWESSVSHARSGVELAERSGDAAALAKALAMLALRETHDSADRALELLDRGARLEQALPEPLPVTNSPTVLGGFVLLNLDRLDEARVVLEEAYQRGLALGHMWRSIVLTYLAELECRAGNWERSLAHAQEADELGRQWGHANAEAWTRYGRALVAAHLGDVEAARAAGARSRELAGETGHLFTLARVDSVLGFLELSLGDFDAALERLGPLVGLPGFTPLRASPGFRPATDAVEALLGLGRVDQAEELAQKVERRATGRGLPSRLAAARRSRALVLAERADLDGAGAAIADALRAHAHLSEPFELGRTLLAQGVIERRAKRRGEAREALEHARTIFDRLGARLWLEKARHELERTGLRRTPDDELTPTEQQVAELAAGGATNKEIAGALFMSVKTVESNLSRVYRKLEIRSRTELASRLTKSS
jgi:DNA-binding CsgD family transcriptional regulator